MKKVSLVILIFLINCSVFSQSYYETKWSVQGVEYTGLLIFYEDDDAFMRVKYKEGEIYKVAEFDCSGEYFEEDGVKGYLLDGKDAKVVYGNNGAGYSADNFIFLDEGNGTYGNPFHIDDQGLEEEPVEDYFTEVTYWQQISTDKFTEEYVYSFFEKSDPLYHDLISYNLNVSEVSTTNSNETTEKFRITSVAYGGNSWACIMSKNTTYTAERWRTRTYFPSEEINAGWEEDYDITELSYGNGKWLLVMSKGTGYQTQRWKTREHFPETEIDEGWDEGYDITSLNYGQGNWALVMSKGTGYTDQIWELTDDFPTDEISEGWNDDYYISSLTFGAGKWALVMSEGTGYTNQRWKKREYFPEKEIQEGWDEGYDITSLSYGNGNWVLVMSKGTDYVQSWKTGTTFPNQWIEDKWNEQNNTNTNDQPEIVEDVKLHLILVTNTLINDIGLSCKVDKQNTLNEFEVICDGLEIPMNKIVIADKEFKKETVKNALDNLTPGANDIVVFIYSGHGYRWSDQESKYPNLDLRYSNYQQVSTETSYNLQDIYTQIVGKGARLNIVIGDCCNSDIGVTKRGGEPSLASRQQSQGKLDRLRTLFLKSSGNLIVAAAKPYETSCGNTRDGGYFTSSFFAAIGKETSRLNENQPTWDNIISNAINTAKYKTQNLNGCDPQNGIYKSTIK